MATVIEEGAAAPPEQSPGHCGAELAPPQVHGQGKGKGKGKGPAPPPPAPKAAVRGPPARGEDRPQLKLRVRGEGEALAAAPFTVVTNILGSRAVEQSDGIVTKVGKHWRAEDGVPEGTENTAAMVAESLDSLIAAEPSLAEYAAQYKSGVPLKVLKSRVTGELGSSLAEAFLAATLVGSISRSLPAEKPAVHGRLGREEWSMPRLAVVCADIARPGYESGAAHEFLDVEEVLVDKVRLLADLVRRAKRLVVYAGAGLSTASGISDYATRTGGAGVVSQQTGPEAPKPLSPYSAKPSLGHRVLAAMGRAGFIWRFVQQNHDGLPQKAGFPQHLMNEIHGAWFDPSNPVVPMSGSLREDLFKDLMACEREADMVLTLGSSLCGMNSDRLVSTCANRARSKAALGSVIVSLQQTPHDEESSVRLFATIDDVMRLLAKELSLEVPDADQEIEFPVPEAQLPRGAKADVFMVPYDAEGMRVQTGQPGQTLDLREGADLTITTGKNRGQRATVLGKNDDGHFRIALFHNAASRKWNEVRLLGRWWPAAAAGGRVPQLPVVNTAPPDAAAAGA